MPPCWRRDPKRSKYTTRPSVQPLLTGRVSHPFITCMAHFLHPLEPIEASVTLPDVRYAGRCPATGRERALGPTPAVMSAAAALMRYLASRRDASTGFSTGLSTGFSTG